MRYLKSFKEAVIIPDKMKTGQINSFSALKKYGEKNGFDVVDYDEFYQSLSDEDKKTAPPRIGVPFFALYHPERKKPMFVLVDKGVIRFLLNFKEIVDDIIGHERVHAGQFSRRKGGEYILPNPNDKKKYFSNKEEIMAFSWTIANDVAKLSKDFDTAIDRFKSGRFSYRMDNLWRDIVKLCDEDVVNRYRKMIYQYLDKMFKKEIISESKLYHEISHDEYTMNLLVDLDEKKITSFTRIELSYILQFFDSRGIRYEVISFSGVEDSAIRSKFSIKRGNWIYEYGFFIRRLEDEWFSVVISFKSNWIYPHSSGESKVIQKHYKCDQVDGVVQVLETFIIDDKINESNYHQSYQEIPEWDFFLKIYDEDGNIITGLTDEFTDVEILELSSLISKSPEVSNVVEFDDSMSEEGFIHLYQNMHSLRINQEVGSVIDIIIYKLKDEWFYVCVQDYRDIHTTAYLPIPKAYIKYFKCDQFDGLLDLLKAEIKRFY